MFSKLILLAGAFHASLGLAATQGFNDESQIGAYLKTHSAFINSTGEVEHPVEKRAFGNAFLSNRCYHDVWMWSVDGKGSSGAIRVPARTYYREPMRTSCEGCGTVFKVSNTDQLLAGKHTQFEYAIKDNILYYDISFVDCAQGSNADNCPGHDRGVHAEGGVRPPCGVVNCPAGSYCPENVYYVPQPLITLGIPEPVFGCGNAGTGMDLWYFVCNDDGPYKRSVAGRLEIDGEMREMA